jgi:hypothetical protein
MMATFGGGLRGMRSSISDWRKHLLVVNHFFLKHLITLVSSFFKALKTLSHDPIPRFDATHFPTSLHAQSVLSIPSARAASG